MGITITAPAKINISLDVLGKRPDGYHELRSIFQTVSLYDYVTIEESDGQEHSMRVVSPEGEELPENETGIPTDERNLMMKAVAALTEFLKEMHSPKTIPPVRMTVWKNIPSQAGLGGGSSDAAAVLYGLNSLFKLGLTTAQLEKVALPLGADVPFFFTGGTAVCSGVGEVITPITPLEDVNILIAKPEGGASTKEIFEKLDQKSDYIHPDTDALIKELENRPMDLKAVFSKAKNVLQPVTEELCPEVIGQCAEMRKLGAFAAFMTGSGTACCGIFEDEKGPISALKRLYMKYPGNAYFPVKPTKKGLEEKRF